MFKRIQQIYQQQELRRNLFAFLEEMEKNLENFYVMDQRQFMTTGFVLKQWPKVNTYELVKGQQAIAVYAQAVEEFNQLLTKHKEYERWYASDMKNKTPENARQLHAMKQDLDQKLKSMETVIITAGQALEKEMLRLGFFRL